MKPVLIITHGMGEHTEASFKKEVVDAINTVYDQYPQFKGKKIEDVIDIECVEYNSIFNTHREAMANSGNIHQTLAGIPNQTNISEITGVLTKLTSGLSKDTFFNTHLFDVILYRFTVLGELCRIKLGKKIIAEVESRGGPYVHVLGHSLGTSVLHDTLASAYDKNFKIGGVNTGLSPSMHRLGSIHMVANVSRLLESFVKVSKSVVSPGAGCTNKYREYRHRYDPFTWIKPFDPTETPPWVPSKYKLTQIKRIAQFNTHDVAHYIQNPFVHREMLPFFDKVFWPSKNEKHHADKAFKDKTALGKYKKVATQAEQLNFKDPNSIIAFYKAAIAFKQMIENMGEEFI